MLLYQFRPVEELEFFFQKESVGRDTEPSVSMTGGIMKKSPDGLPKGFYLIWQYRSAGSGGVAFDSKIRHVCITEDRAPTIGQLLKIFSESERAVWDFLSDRLLGFGIVVARPVYRVSAEEADLLIKELEAGFSSGPK